MQSLSADLSILTPYGYQSGSCGYCKDESSSQRTPNSRASYYAKSKQLAPRHYQALIDRGWRRSGQLLYLPDNRRSCCPHYTIRLPVADFRPSRDQRQTLHRWNRFLLGESYEKDFRRLHPTIARQLPKQSAGFDLCATVHAPEYSSLPRPGGLREPLNPQPAHEYHVTLEPSSFTEEKFLLYQLYQDKIHGEPAEETTRPSFKRFLCQSPLTPQPNPTAPSRQNYGSYHQLHRLDGKLMAMSVIDILPHGISAVYFIYDPFYHKYGLGKVSALREASLAIEEAVTHYYMGYYIHSCPKMRYKADYKPQKVLDLDMLAASSTLGEAAEQRAAPVWRPLNDEDVCREMENRSFGLGERAAAENAETPKEAEDSGKTMFELRIPGLTPLSTILQKLDLGMTKVFVNVNGREAVLPVKLLVSWSGDDDEGVDKNADEAAGPNESAFLETGSLKSIMAELVAAVGIDVARELVVGFGS